MTVGEFTDSDDDFINKKPVVALPIKYTGKKTLKRFVVHVFNTLMSKN